MIVRLLDLVDVIRYRLRAGAWCEHPATAERQQLIDTGMRKMFWCGDCNGNSLFT